MRYPFHKNFTSPHDLVQLLESRGLLIHDRAKAEHCLTHISYYRLSAYMYPLLEIPKENHTYKTGASFEKVMMLYSFDKKLRLLIFNEIEKIEISLRSAIVNIGCEMFGDCFWMTNSKFFSNTDKFDKTMGLIDEELNRSHEVFIAHFKETYTEPYPPAWILVEILPLGLLTRIYTNIKEKRVKKRIAQSFDLQIAPFESWVTIITLTRNACCHHARIWNKKNTIQPMSPEKMNRKWITLPADPLRVYFNLCIIKYFLDRISPENNLTTNLQTLFLQYPEIDLRALGCPSEWASEPLWK
ncbi:MAG: Abi family protein [Porphyromonadaceae bacterium]|nr:Abi family protein [Porphyromonadaceae bacterium]